MSDYVLLHSAETPFSRGRMTHRFYDRLSVDFLMHHQVRISVRAKKCGKPYSATPLRRTLRLPITNRNFVES